MLFCSIQFLGSAHGPAVVSEPLEPRLNPSKRSSMRRFHSDSQVHRVASIELVVTFDRVLVLAIPGDPVGVEITEAYGVGPQSRAGPRVIEKKSLNTAVPSMVKSSTRNVFEIRSLSVARKVMPISPSVFGRLASPVMLYWPRLSMFGVAAGGVGGQPVTLGLSSYRWSFHAKQ